MFAPPRKTQPRQTAKSRNGSDAGSVASSAHDGNHWTLTYRKPSDFERGSLNKHANSEYNEYQRRQARLAQRSPFSKQHDSMYTFRTDRPKSANRPDANHPEPTKPLVSDFDIKTHSRRVSKAVDVARRRAEKHRNKKAFNSRATATVVSTSGRTVFERLFHDAQQREVALEARRNEEMLRLEDDLESTCSEYLASHSRPRTPRSRAATPMSMYGPEDTMSMVSGKSAVSQRTRSRTPVSMYGALSECYSLASLGSYYDTNASTLRRIVPRSDYMRHETFVDRLLSDRKGAWSATPRFSRVLPTACRGN